MSDSDEIKAELDKITAMMADFQTNLNPLVQQQKNLEQLEQASYQKYLEEVGVIRHEKTVIQQKLNEAQQSINAMKQKTSILNAKFNELKRKEEDEAKAKALQEEWLTLHTRWDALTMGAPWREWAKDHQIEGAKKVTGDLKVIIADPMGLGKTLTSIMTCDMAQKATQFASPSNPFLGEEATKYNYNTGQNETVIVGGVTKPAGRKILYICPSPMIRNVEAEFRMWAPHRSVLFIGGMSRAERAFAIEHLIKPKTEVVVIINYEAWRKDLKLLDTLADIEFDTVIIDEAHMVKDTKSLAYRGVKALIEKLDPPYIMPMTGTPILNRPQEIYSLLTLVAPNQFYHLNNFLFDYCEQDYETGFWKFKPGGLERLQQRIGKHIMRRTKEQAGIQLPDKTVTIHRLQVDTENWPHQAKVREQMRKHYAILLKDDKAITAPAMIAVFTRLRQIETWPAGIEVKDPITKEVKLKVDVEESQKIDYLIHKENGSYEGLIPEVITDERVVLFSQFKAPLREIRDRVEAAGWRAVVLDGDTPSSLKEEIRIDFDARHTTDRKNSKWDIVLCNYKVGGVGMNLTCASQMIILDEEWNPGKRDQAYDRIHRIGQELPVTIHVIRNEKTIDDWLADIMEAKEGLVDGFNKAVSADKLMEWLNDDSGLA